MELDFQGNSALCLALKRAAVPLPFVASFAMAGDMLDTLRDSWKTRPKCLNDWGSTSLLAAAARLAIDSELRSGNALCHIILASTIHLRGTAST